MKLHELIIKSAENAVKSQSKDGSMPAGHNGPYIDPETPVRNTSHWLITFCKCYELTKDKVYEEAAEKAINYLLSRDARPMGASFWHRKNPRKDFANGLMGQAWTIEALIKGYETFGNKKLLDLAEEVFLLHPYDEGANGWFIMNVDGSRYRLDGTYNHQLWFAAAGVLISKHAPSNISQLVNKFIHSKSFPASIYSDGCVRHLTLNFLANTKERKLKNLYFQKIKGPGNAYMRMKSVGYHGFNLYAFALINSVMNDLKYWGSSDFKKISSVPLADSFKEEMLNSSYGYPYNPPGIEISFGLQTFFDDRREHINYWLNTQFSKTLNKDNYQMELGKTKDPVTAAARIYEATRLENYDLDI